MAEIVLTDGVKNETSVFKIEAHEETDFGPSHIEEDVWSTLIRSLGVSQLQILHIIVFGKLIMNTLMFVICSVVKDENQDILEEDASKKEDFDRKLLDHSYGAFKLGFIAFMTMTFATTNGINFAYSNFVTKFAVNSELSLNKSQGARITAIYFGCSAITKFVTIGMLKIFKPIRLIVLNVILLAIASVILLLFANESLLAYQSGTALAGIGTSTLFSNGVLWMQSQLELGSQVTAMLLIATTIGAQVVKIPVVAWIDTYPMSLMWIFLICTIGISISFFFAKVITIAAIYATQKDTRESVYVKNDDQSINSFDDSSEKSLLELDV